MTKLIQISFFLSCFALSISAQTNKYDLVSPDEPFILLTNDSLLFENDFTMDKRLFQTKYYHKNGEEIKGSEIRFMGIDSELYAYSYFNTDGTPASHISPLAIRKEIGKLDLYLSYSTHPNSSRSISYSKKFGGLKPLKYKFLKEDLLSNSGPDVEQRNALMLDYLEKGQRKRKTGFAMMGGGFVAFMVGAAIADKNERSIPGWTLSLGGLTTMIVGLKKTTKEKEIYLEAVRAYNRF